MEVLVHDTLEKARKKAEDVSSSDERDVRIEQGRSSRKRKCIPLKTIVESSDDEATSSNIKHVKLPSPPYHLDRDTILMDDIPIIFTSGKEKLQGVPRVIAECKSDSQRTEPGPSSKPITKPVIVSSQILQKPLIIEKVSLATQHQSQTIVPSPKSSSSSNLIISGSDSDTLTSSDFIDTFQRCHDSSIVTTSSPRKSSQTPMQYSKGPDSHTNTSTITLRQLIENKLDTLFLKVAEIAVDLTAVKDCLTTLQTRSVNQSCAGKDIALDIIEAAFPFRNKPAVLKFEADLGNTILQSNVNLCLKKIGGTGMKESLIRILRKVFANQFAKESSWLGQRGNFKIQNLGIMKCIRDVIAAKYNHTDKEFDDVASEWFRQANQRYARELAQASKKNNTL